MKVFKSIIYGLLLFTIYSCTSTSLEELEPIVTPPPVNETITYNPDIANIMNANCTSCHGGPSPQAGLDLTTYTNVRFAVENRNLVSRMNNISAPMPPDGILPSTTLQIIDDWIADGSLEN